MQYSIEDLVRLARRDNNPIRPYLYVNPLQGKHIPTRPEETLGMCKKLAEIVNAAHPVDKLFVIGFAETATGIASATCCYLDNVVYYQNTTREFKIDDEYLYFTESHSHATDQMLRSKGLAGIISEVNRIIFIDDEVTTGNTICKLVNVIKREYAIEGLKFSIVSILNSMTQERIRELREHGIDCLYLAELPFEYKKDSIMSIEYDSEKETANSPTQYGRYNTLIFDAEVNTRSVTRFDKYLAENLRFTLAVEDELLNNHFGKLLVLGTEEFMFPAIYLGNYLREKGVADEVMTHATTRSPIFASGKKGYPLFHRYQIKSLYDDARNTYIYNLEKYDKVIIVTDAENIGVGAKDLLCVLKSIGNENIMIAQWRYNK